MITIECTDTKTKKTKKYPSIPYCGKKLLKEKLGAGKNQYVFLGNDGVTLKKVRTGFEKACRMANVKDLRFHDLRHTAATRMIENGANIVAVSRILGHSTLSMTMRYTHPDDSIRDALENLARNHSKKRSNSSRA